MGKVAICATNETEINSHNLFSHFIRNQTNDLKKL